MAAGPEQLPDVAQGPGEGGQVRADALQAEAGHQAVGPCGREDARTQRLGTVHVDGEDVGDRLTELGRLLCPCRGTESDNSCKGVLYVT